jgi:SAM-dependent methyltransferase
MRTVALFRGHVRDLGLAATLRLTPRLLFAPLAMRRLRRRKFEQLSRDGFDAAHGTDTAAVLVGRELGPCLTGSGHLVVHYETTSEAAIRAPLDALALDFSAFTFVDLGCGKGKPLMVAASYPFRRLVGVDISPACIAVARRNVARFGPRKIDPSRVSLLAMDVEEFAFPEEPLVVYLFNPFPGAVLERVVANLETSLTECPRPVALVYVNPHALAAVARSALFVRLPGAAEVIPAPPGSPAYERAAVFVTRSGTGRGPGTPVAPAGLPGGPTP